MGRRWSVRRLLQTLLVANTLVVLLVGMIGALAVHETTQTVDTLSQELGPAQKSNSRFMEAMLDSETELRAFIISGEAVTALRLPGGARAGARGRGGAARLRARTTRTWTRWSPPRTVRPNAWVGDFATAAIRSGGGPGTYDRRSTSSAYDASTRSRPSTARSPPSCRREVVAGARGAAGPLDSTARPDRRDRPARRALGCCALGWWALRSHPAAARPGSRQSWTGWPRASARRAPRTRDRRRSAGSARRSTTSPRRTPAPASRAPGAAAADGRRPGQVRVRLQRLPRAAYAADDHHRLPRAAHRRASRARSTTSEAEMMLAIAHRNVGAPAGPDRGPPGAEQHRAPAPSTLEQVDLRRVLEDVAKDVRILGRRAAASRSRWTTTGRPGPSYSPTRGSCTAPLLNLVSNAVKFSREGGEVRMRLGARRTEVEVRSPTTGSASPRGPGQAGGAVLPGLQRGDGEVPGTGLGLRIVKSIVDNHHGTFGLSSVEGRGHHGDAPAAPAARPSSRERRSTGEQTTARQR